MVRNLLISEVFECLWNVSAGGRVIGIFLHGENVIVQYKTHDYILSIVISSAWWTWFENRKWKIDEVFAWK